MTCFWDGIIKSLTIDDFKTIGNFQRKPNAKQFADFLQSKNKLIEIVIWQNTELSKQEQQECFDAINELDTNSIRSGYLCSSCDPFLLLLCELFCIHIIHKYNGNILEYKHKQINRKTIIYQSSKSHFWN